MKIRTYMQKIMTSQDFWQKNKNMKIRASGRPISVYITKIMEVLQPIKNLDCKVNFKKKKKNKQVKRLVCVS